VTIEAPSPLAPAPARPALPPDEEALFPEARQLRRRRWTIGILVAVLVGGIVALVVLTVARGDAARTAAAPSAAGVLPVGPFATLRVAGPLAVAPDGALYVADVAADRVLVRLPNGRFRVVAGDGRAGFSGDGEPAVRAELAAVSDLAFAPDGALYIADGGRVRVVSPAGMIRTIAGNGHGVFRPQSIADGTPALSASLGSARALSHSGGPLSIALGARGRLYISADWQILHLTATGRLDTVPEVIASGPLAGQPLNSFGPIAVDARGNIDVAGVNGWSIWQVSRDAPPRDIANQLARRSGGDDSVLERGPGGAVFGEDGSTILRVDQNKLTPVFRFTHDVNGEYFTLTYFAFAPGGVVYADEIPGGQGYGFEAHQQLLSVSGKRVSLLWQQPN
jgi:hypothetical protein